MNLPSLSGTTCLPGPSSILYRLYGFLESCFIGGLLARLGVQPGQRLEVEVLPDGRLELHAAQVVGEIDAVFGLLAGRADRRASLEEIAS